jgi:SagB-type dehydrogenase family enzyme
LVNKMRSYEEITGERRTLLKALGMELEGWRSDQSKGVPPPPVEKPFPEDGILFDLVNPEDLSLGRIPLIEAIKRRQTHRRYADDALTLEGLSFLLWATQGVRSVDKESGYTKRTVPSGGSRHPFETYLIVNRVEGIRDGVYRYLPIEHKLLLLAEGDPGLPDRLVAACDGQSFMGRAAVVFVWAAIPYRTEWSFGALAYKDIVTDAGHICQNLYLACEAIEAGTCAVNGYNQAAMDALLGVDGEDEFTVYLAPVGKVMKA